MAEKWAIEFSVLATRDITHLDRPLRRRVIAKLEWLSIHFDETPPVPLQGEFGGFYKLRAGDLRILYRIEWSTHCLIVHYIDRRDCIYKK
ncbi:MAG: type II toxin-antitoxin system RelE/ParE family toxin [Patescibacteria group bacterium]|nr:type II toxin-antitoxin system RelE/ParE family toxin [Patescibacteria group bacterium]